MIRAKDIRSICRTLAFACTAKLVSAAPGWEENVYFIALALCATIGWKED